MENFSGVWQWLTTGMSGFTGLFWGALAASPFVWLLYVQLRYWWFWRKRGGRKGTYRGNGEIEARLGKMGMGKSYTLTYTVYHMRLANPDLPIYTNIPLKLPGKGPVYALRGLEDFLLAENGLMIIDELNTVLPSRTWKSAPAVLLYKWSHLRKDGLDLIYTAQHEKRIDTVIRELTTRWVHLSNWQRLGFIIGRMYQDFGMGKPSTMGMSFVLAPFMQPKVLEAYDSYVRVKPQEWVTGKEKLDALHEHKLVTWDELRQRQQEDEAAAERAKVYEAAKAHAEEYGQRVAGEPLKITAEAAPGWKVKVEGNTATFTED